MGSENKHGSNAKPAPGSTPNRQLAEALAAQPSRAVDGMPMSRHELADAVNIHLAGRGIHTYLTAKDIGRYIRGETRWPRAHYRQALRTILGATTDAELGFYPRRNQPRRDTDTQTVSQREPEQHHQELDCLAHVRSALFGARSPGQTQHEWAESATDEERYALVAEVKNSYQAGSYRAALKALPRLLWNFQAESAPAPGRAGKLALAATAYQTACSVLLKLGVHALAMVAADRGMTTARQCGDPVAAAASARAVAAALAQGGHHQLAASVALKGAREVPIDGRASVSELAVYGALLLRMSVIAAASEDRALAWEALSEASEAARRIDDHQNAVWTYFCTANVQLHRVSVAVSLGDAGQAIDHARRVDLSQVPLAERRACFWTDVARAYLQWGKYERAFEAICAAEHAAPEELAARPRVHKVIDELHRRSPPSVRGQVSQLTSRIRAAT